MSETFVIVGASLAGGGAALIGLSGYLGGALVYEHGVRVGEDHDGIPGAS